MPPNNPQMSEEHQHTPDYQQRPEQGVFLKGKIRFPYYGEARRNFAPNLSASILRINKSAQKKMGAISGRPSQYSM